jgi:hypothetical protein
MEVSSVADCGWSGAICGWFKGYLANLAANDGRKRSASVDRLELDGSACQNSHV